MVGMQCPRVLQHCGNQVGGSTGTSPFNLHAPVSAFANGSYQGAQSSPVAHVSFGKRCFCAATAGTQSARQRPSRPPIELHVGGLYAGSTSFFGAQRSPVVVHVSLPSWDCWSAGTRFVGTQEPW